MFHEKLTFLGFFLSCSQALCFSPWVNCMEPSLLLPSPFGFKEGNMKNFLWFHNLMRGQRKMRRSGRNDSTINSLTFVGPFFPYNYNGDWIWMASINWWLVNHTTHEYIVCVQKPLLSLLFITLMLLDKLYTFCILIVPTNPCHITQGLLQHSDFIPSSCGLFEYSPLGKMVIVSNLQYEQCHNCHSMNSCSESGIVQFCTHRHQVISHLQQPCGVIWLFFFNFQMRRQTQRVDMMLGVVTTPHS